MSSSSWIGNQYLYYLFLLTYVLLWGPVRSKDVGCEVPIVRAEQIGHCPGVWRDKFFERGLIFFGLYEAMHSDVGGGRLLLYNVIARFFLR